MIPQIYRIKKHATIDELYSALALYECAIKKDLFLSTAPTYKKVCLEEIKKRRDRGEETIMEHMQRVTGNTFIIMKSK